MSSLVVSFEDRERANGLRPALCALHRVLAQAGTRESRILSRRETSKKTRRIPLVGCTLCWHALEL